MKLFTDVVQKNIILSFTLVRVGGALLARLGDCTCLCVYSEMDAISSTYRTCFSMKGSETLKGVHSRVAFKAEKLLIHSC